MDVILLTKVANLGNIGDRVKVKSGYGRNFLLPKGKSTFATPENVKKFEARWQEAGDDARPAFKDFKLQITAKACNGRLRTTEACKGRQVPAKPGKRLQLHTDIDVQLVAAITTR